MTFRGSIPHPMQSLCTLRNRCRQRPRNTRYQAGRYPLLGPDLHRLDRTSLRLAHSFDHLVGDGEYARRNCKAECLGRLEIDHELERSRLLDRQVGGLCALEDFSGEDAGTAISIAYARAVAHQAASSDELTHVVNRRNGVASCQRHELVTPIDKKWIGAEQKHPDTLLDNPCEGT